MRNSKDRTFSDKIKMRIRLLWAVLILMLIYMVFIGEMGWGDSRFMTTLAQNVSTIIFFGGLVYVVARIVKNRKILNNKHLLLSQSKKEADERQQFLHDKSGGIIVDILLLFLLFSTCTTALINMPAFYTSFIILSVALILKIGSHTIYSRIY